jgi:type II secretory pathway pseudopilin PulG
MRKLAVLAGAVAVAVFATSALSGTAAVKQAAREQARAATLQQQVNELRNELICVEAVTGNGLAQDLYAAHSANGSPTPDSPVDERGVCKKLGVSLPGTTPDGTVSQAFRRLIVRAFGG